MLLIQSLTSIICFVLLIHEGLGLDYDFYDDYDFAVKGLGYSYDKYILFERYCREDVYWMLKHAGTAWKRLFDSNGGYTFPTILFIPDGNLIDILASLEDSYRDRRIRRPNVLGPDRIRAPARKWWDSIAFIQNPVELGREETTIEGLDLRFIKLAVNHLDGPQGKAKFVCAGESCNDLYKDFEQYLNGTQRLLCLSGKRNNGNTANIIRKFPGPNNIIKASIFFEYVDIFDADRILYKLIRSATSETQSWRATGAELNDNVITFNDKHGQVVAQVSLPARLDAVGIEYIKAAVNVLNAFERGMTYVYKNPADPPDDLPDDLPADPPADSLYKRALGKVQSLGNMGRSFIGRFTGLF